MCHLLLLFQIWKVPCWLFYWGFFAFVIYLSSKKGLFSWFRLHVFLSRVNSRYDIFISYNWVYSLYKNATRLQKYCTFIIRMSKMEYILRISVCSKLKGFIKLCQFRIMVLIWLNFLQGRVVLRILWLSQSSTCNFMNSLLHLWLL